MAMLSKRALRELLSATLEYPGGLVIVEENEPKFVVLDYASYQRLVAAKGKAGAVSPVPKRILVTGGAGYIGSHVARALVDQGNIVTTFDNLSTGMREFAQGTFVEGDLGDTALLDQVFLDGKFDAVMHFAASIEVGESVEKPMKYYHNNVINGLKLLSAMAKHNVRRLVFSSTCAIYSDDAPVPISEASPILPMSPYAQTKLDFERVLHWYAKSYGLKSVSLRYFNAAGASLDATLGLANAEPSHLIPNVLQVAAGQKESVVVHGNDYKTQDGTGVRDYIHVVDLAEAHGLALQYLFTREEGFAEAFNVGSGRGYSVLEIINTVCEITGHMVRFEIGPRRPGDREKVIADASKIKRVLGFTPKHSDLKTIIETAWAWHQRRFGNRKGKY